jgi:hypothetical protein
MSSTRLLAPTIEAQLDRITGHAWGLAAAAVAVALSATYVLTHPYPSYGAGLYMHIAELIRVNGYRLPDAIHAYAGTIPAAYPPLMFYAAAFVVDVTGVSPLTYARLVPAAVTVIALVPFYLLAGELTRTRRQAGFATLLLATSPAALQWHISAGGIVRAPAFALSLAGVYAGVQVFTNGRRRWAAAGLVLFGLSILSHPVYTAFFGLSWLVLYAFHDRTLRGLAVGASVAAGGVLLAAPWWLSVVASQGPGVFFAAAGTHSGLGGGPHRLLDQFVYPLDPSVAVVFFVAVFAAAAWMFRERRYFLPVWFVAVAYVIGKERFQFVPGSLMVALVFFDVVVPTIRRRVEGVDQRHVAAVLVAAVLVPATVGTLYAGGALASAHHGSPSQPAFIDDSDRAAMAWAAENTAPDADFVVAGDAAEWFPLLTDRPISIGPWGVEWTTPERYETQLSLYRDVSHCGSAACLSWQLERAGVYPDYVYVPKDTYTVRGLERTQTSWMRSTLVDADAYELVYESDEVIIVRVTSAGPSDPRPSAQPPDGTGAFRRLRT